MGGGGAGGDENLDRPEQCIGEWVGRRGWVGWGGAGAACVSIKGGGGLSSSWTAEAVSSLRVSFKTFYGAFLEEAASSLRRCVSYLYAPPAPPPQPRPPRMHMHMYTGNAYAYVYMSTLRV